MQRPWPARLHPGLLGIALGLLGLSGAWRRLAELSLSAANTAADGLLLRGQLPPAN